MSPHWRTFLRYLRGFFLAALILLGIMLLVTSLLPIVDDEGVSNHA